MTESIIEILEFFKTDYPDISYIKEIKSGKEATVHLVKSKGEMLALKIYKQYSQNASRGIYMSTAQLDSRTRRAIHKRTNRGRQMEKRIWTEQEFTTMKKLSQLGANVPMPYSHNGSAILMQFLGDEIDPAPRLTDCQLTTEQARSALQIILRDLSLLLNLDLVHGDLSAYNILWYEEEPYIIDFPQVLDLKNNTAAYAKLDKDLENIQKYFSKYIEIDVAAELESMTN